MRFMLQHSIFIIYISCKGNRCDVPAGRGGLASSWKPFGGSMNPELARVFSELIIQGGEEPCVVAAFC